MKCLLLALFTLTIPLHAREIIVATDVWQGYSAKDSRGYYIDLLRTIFPKPEYQLKFEFVPFKRSIMMLQKGEADILLGAYPSNLPAQQLAKFPTDSDSVSAAVSKQLAKNWNGKQSLTHKKIVARTAYGFDRYFSNPITYSEQPNLKAMLKMLKMGRVDAVLDYKKDMATYWNLLDMQDQWVIIDGVITENVYPGFALDQKDLKAHYEKTFLTLYQNGTIKTLMQKHKIAKERFPIIDNPTP
ncbi:substrate-binding periplasmic protein [Rubritalea tangerina]|uniref:Substrate-binding periplasmic protein n=1 Tax=Rubritalea tangerina TaxID=430798 RepID=A0ABW4ZDK1_9BACT